MLAWINLLGSAAGGAPVVVEDTDKRRRGAPRKRYWWEDDSDEIRFFLPPHTKQERPHEAAIADAKTELSEVRRIKAAPKADIRRLEGKLGGLARSASSLEKKIDAAVEVAEVADQYRALGQKLTSYLDELESLRNRRIERLKDEEEKILQLLLIEADR